LPAPVGVQLVENEELEVLGAPNEFVALARADEHQLQHDVVGQQDVRRVREDRVAVLAAFLACVPGEGDLRVFLSEELLQFADLAVRQGVHRVDDDRLDALAAAVAEHPVDDRDDVGQ